jgi:hypothetical protein
MLDMMIVGGEILHKNYLQTTITSGMSMKTHSGSNWIFLMFQRVLLKINV